MSGLQLDHELQQEFRDWIESQKIRGIGAPGVSTNPCYIPQQRIVEYFKARKKISQLLQCLGPDGNLEDFQNHVVENYPNVLCILLIIGQGHHIGTFARHNGLSDTQLPFEHKPALFPFADDGSDFFERFKETQWQFCAQPLIYNMDLVYEDARILPIMTKDRIGRGRSSNIFKITLPQAYDELEPDSSSEKKNPSFRNARTYVLKTYSTGDSRSYYTNEIRAFRRVLGAGSTRGFIPGLIGFHGNFIHGGTHNVLLEYADKGTLEQFFKEFPPPATEDDIVSFWRSLFYPIFALLKIHNTEDHDLDIFQGRRQDIKPDNILVVSNDKPSPYQYEFKLADVGLTHFRKSKGTNGDAVDMYPWGTRTYGAPESYRADSLVGPANLRVSKSMDIWSLGCVYSEAATWLVLGKEGLQHYRSERKEETNMIPDFGDAGCFHDGEKILKTVERTHNDILAYKCRTDHITRPVLQKMVQEMLDEEGVRPNAKLLWEKSQGLLRRAKDPRPSSMWSSSSESSLSSKTHTVRDLPAELPAGTQEFPQSPPALTPTTATKRRMRDDNGNFTGEDKRLEYSSEGTSGRPQNARSPPNTNSPSTTRLSHHYSNSVERPSNPQRLEQNSYWSVDSAQLWKETQRKRGFRSRSAPEGGETFMELISERDHVIILDDSPSMRSTDWSSLTSRVSLLTYIVRLADPDGLDLYFSSSSNPMHSKKSSDLTDAVIKRYSQPVGSDNLKKVLETVLQGFHESRFGSGGNKGFFGRRKLKRKKPMTCYILTDGAWCSDINCDIETVIQEFVDELLQQEAGEKDFGIEFISFGDHQEGLQTLEHLARGLNLKRDIVDTEPANGNVWKMLLGSINRIFDDDSLESLSETKVSVPPPSIHAMPKENSTGVAPNLAGTVAFSTTNRTTQTRNTQISSVFSELVNTSSISDPSQHMAGHDSSAPSLPGVDKKNASLLDSIEESPCTQSSESIEEEMSVEANPQSDAVDTESMWSRDSVPLTGDQRNDIVSVFSTLLYTRIHAQDIAFSLPKLFDKACQDLVEAQVKKYSETILQGPNSSELKLTRKASKAIHSFARQITEKFQSFASNYLDGGSEEELERPEGEDQTYLERVETWDLDTTSSPDMSVGNDQDREDYMIPQAQLGPSLDREALCESLTNHPAFQVLADQVINVLRHYGNNIMHVIEKSTAARLSPRTMRARRVVLRAEWDALEFIENQYRSIRNFNLGHTLTITGNSLDAQMMTTSDYLAQTWPSRDEKESWGPHSLLSAVQDAISQHRHGQTARKIFTYHEHTATVEVTCDRGQTVVTAIGPDEILLDVSQQLAWLGSACRASSSHHGLSYCDTIWSDGPSTNDQNEASFHITYSIAPLCENEDDRCWRNLIGNSVIAAGFPIAKRSEEMIGLQIPLDVMALLGHVSNVSGNDSGIVLKGPYVAFIPVKRNRTKDQIQWHLLQDGDSFISYEDVLSQPRLRLSEFDGDSLSSTTAFLGWTPQVMNCAATGRIEYGQIARSEESQPSEWSVHFTGFQFAFSKVVSASATFTLGKKDFGKDAWRPSNLYGPLCEEASKQSVILYDTKAKRGWLTNAERVVFQIILHGLEKRKFSYVSENARSKIRPANECDTHSVRSRMNEYCEVELFQTRDISKREMVKFCFADLVKELLDAMSFLISESQRCTKERSGDLVGLVKRLGPQEILAYEYMDVLERSTKKMPRTVPLEDSCGKWPTFARDVQALILAGQDFQEVLQPHPSASKCSSFASLPTAKSYLAVELSTLRMLSKADDGQGRLGPSGLHWDASKGLFDRCPSEDGQECQCKRIQGFSKSTQRMLVDQSHSNGAVIFGEESNRRSLKGAWNRAFPGSHTTKPEGLSLHSNGNAAAVSQNENGSWTTPSISTIGSGTDVAPMSRETSCHPTSSSLSINGYSNFERNQLVSSPIQPVSTVPLNTSTRNSSRRPDAVYHR